MQAVNGWQDSYVLNNSACEPFAGVACEDYGSSSDNGLHALAVSFAASSNNAVTCTQSPFQQAAQSKPVSLLESCWPAVDAGFPDRNAASMTASGACRPTTSFEPLCTNTSKNRFLTANCDGPRPVPSPQGKFTIVDGGDGLAKSSCTPPLGLLAPLHPNTSAAPSAAATAKTGPTSNTASAAAAESSGATPLVCPDPAAQLGSASSTTRLSPMGPTILASASVPAAAYAAAPARELQLQPLQQQRTGRDCWPPAASGRPTAAATSAGLLGPGAAAAAANLSLATASAFGRSAADCQARLACGPPVAAPAATAAACRGGGSGNLPGFASRAWGPCRLAAGLPEGLNAAAAAGGAAAAAGAAREGTAQGALALRPECPFDWGLQLPRWEEAPGGGCSGLSQAHFEERMAAMNREAWNPRPTRPLTTPATSLGRWLAAAIASATPAGGCAAAAAANTAGCGGPGRVAAKLAAVKAPAAAAPPPPLSRRSSATAAVTAVDHNEPHEAAATACPTAAADVGAATEAAGPQRRGTATGLPSSPESEESHPQPAAAAVTAAAAATSTALPVDSQDAAAAGGSGSDGQGSERQPTPRSGCPVQGPETATAAGDADGVTDVRRRSGAGAGATCGPAGGLLMATVARLAAAEGRTPTEPGLGRTAGGDAAATIVPATADTAGGTGSRAADGGDGDAAGACSKDDGRECSAGGGGDGGRGEGCCLLAAAAGVKRRLSEMAARGEGEREQQGDRGVPHPALRRELLLSAIEEQLQLKPLAPPLMAEAVLSPPPEACCQ